MNVSRSVYQVRHPRGSYILIHPLLPLEVATVDFNQSIGSCHPLHVRSCDPPSDLWVALERKHADSTVGSRRHIGGLLCRVAPEQIPSRPSDSSRGRILFWEKLAFFLCLFFLLQEIQEEAPCFCCIIPPSIAAPVFRGDS